MDEQKLAREAAAPKRMEPVGFLVVDTDGSLRVVSSRVGNMVVSAGPEATMRHLAHVWHGVLRNITFLSRWIGRLDASLVPVMAALKVPPTPINRDTIQQAGENANMVFTGLLRSLPGTMQEKFAAMGSPPLLAYACGMRETPLSDAEYTRETTLELMGRPATPMPVGGKSKPTWEPATGLQWPSAAAMAKSIGCAAISAYMHLNGGIATLRGRKFEYLPAPAPDPNLPANWSEERKEVERAKARELGFEPLF